MSNIILNNNNHHNNDNNNSNNNNSIRTNGNQACAACKYQRRKCAPDCLLAPYFPHHLHHQFLNAHRLFGVSNITKIIKPLPQPQKDQAMRTIKFESDVRASDPVGGSYRIIRNLQAQIELACAEHEMVLQQLAICRAAADTVSLMCDPDPQTQSHVVGAEPEGLMNNGVEDRESNEYNDVLDEAISPIHQQTQPQLQTEDGHNMAIDCDSTINNNHEDQMYQHDVRNIDENNDKDHVGIEEYFLEEDNVINDENSNVILSFQDIEASWAMEDALAYCLHDKEGYSNESEDFNANNEHTGNKRTRIEFYDDEPQLFEDSDVVIPKNKKANIQEEETSPCMSKGEKLISREDFTTIEDDESLRTAATMYSTA